jgi:uncharacterized protein (TIGR02117 family)
MIDLLRVRRTERGVILHAWRPARLVLGVSSVLFLAACAPRPPAALMTASTGSRSVYVISNGWHTGLVLPRAQISAEVWPEQGELAPAPFLEVGWGDSAAYLADRITVRVAIVAALGSSAALHLAGLDGLPTERGRKIDVVEVRLTPREFDDLTGFISRSYARDGTGNTIWLARGYTDNSAFYRARGRYHLFNTCNTWTAQALRAAGCPIVSALILTAPQLVAQALSACAGIRPDVDDHAELFTPSTSSVAR